MTAFIVTNAYLRESLGLAPQILSSISQLSLYKYICVYYFLSDQINPDGTVDTHVFFYQTERFVPIESIVGFIRTRTFPQTDRESEQPFIPLCDKVLSRRGNHQRFLSPWRDEWTRLGLKELPIPWGRMTKQNLWMFPREVRDRVVFFFMFWRRLKVAWDVRFIIAGFIATR
jgi:hypothetical protein